MTQGFIQMQKQQEKLKKQKEIPHDIKEISEKLENMFGNKKFPKLEKNNETKEIINKLSIIVDNYDKVEL